MQTVALRKYRVSTEDFPLKVVIAAKNLPACRAVASPVQILLGGDPAGTLDVNTVDDTTAFATSYAIRHPANSTPCDLVQTIHATFGPTATEKSSYEINITSATGDTTPIIISRPTIEPGIAVLEFQLR